MATVGNELMTTTGVTGPIPRTQHSELSLLDREELAAFSVEGTHKEPTEGQIWPRLADN